MMRIVLSTVSLLLIALLIGGCAARKPATTTGVATDEIVKGAPEWYKNPPQDPNYYFGTGTGTSRDMQLARDKATQSATMQIAQDMEKKFNGYRKMFQEEIGTAKESQYLEQITQASKAVTSQLLSGAKMEKSDFRNEEGVFRAYVLYSLPVGSSLEALNNRLSKEEELYTRFRASQAFEEMDKEIEKYEQWKSEQGK